MRPFSQSRALVAAAAMACAMERTVAVAAAQAPPPGGIPDFCANPTITSARSGAWSDPLTWSPARVPSTGDLVRIDAGDTVTYASVSDAALNGISFFGQLAFGTGAPTRLTVGTLTVMEGGVLTIGTMSAPVPAGVIAELDPQHVEDNLDHVDERAAAANVNHRHHLCPFAPVGTVFADGRRFGSRDRKSFRASPRSERSPWPATRRAGVLAHR